MTAVRAWLEKHRQDVAWGAAIFGVAFVARLLFVLWANISPLGLTDDSWFYHHVARSVADGRGYIFPLQAESTARWPPGYPGLLAGVYWLPGGDVVAGKALNIVLGAASATMLFALGRMLWNRGVGIAAGLLLAVFPSHIFYSAFLLSEVTYGALQIGVLLLFGWVLLQRRDAGIALPLCIGVLLGLLALVRGEGLLLLVVFAAVWGFSKGSLVRGAQFGAVLAIGLAAVLSVWTVRNVVQLGAPIPISTGGIRMAQAHWEGASGGSSLQRVRDVHEGYTDLSFTELEVQVTEDSLRDGLTYMVTHPHKELLLIPKRLYYLYRHDHFPIDLLSRKAAPPIGDTGRTRLAAASDTVYYVTIVFAAGGLALWWRSGRRAQALLLIGPAVMLSLLIGILYAGVERYHASLVPLACLAAAPGAVWLVQAARAFFSTAPGGRLSEATRR